MTTKKDRQLTNLASCILRCDAVETSIKDEILCVISKYRALGTDMRIRRAMDKISSLIEYYGDAVVLIPDTASQRLKNSLSRIEEQTTLNFVITKAGRLKGMGSKSLLELCEIAISTFEGKKK